MRIDGQLHVESCAFARFTLDPNPAVMRIDDIFDDLGAQTGAADDS